ncbi:hypothetical protein JCM8097_006727 [Rhodosporidiobolus ruineniae]
MSSQSTKRHSVHITHFPETVLNRICALGSVGLALPTLLYWTLTCRAFYASGTRAINRVLADIPPEFRAHLTPSSKLLLYPFEPEQRPTSRNLTLPEEVLEHICDQIDCGDRASLSDFRSWMLTCRAFVSSGERALYRTPFRLQIQRISSRPNAFLCTLKDRPELAQHVKNLGCLGDVTAAMLRVKTDTFDALEWQNSVLHFALRVQTVGVCIGDVQAARELGKAFAPAAEAVTLFVRFLRSTDKLAPRIRAFLEASGSHTDQPRVFERVAFVLPPEPEQVDDADEGSLPIFEASSLHLDLGAWSLPSLVHLLPGVGIRLVTLTLTFLSPLPEPVVVDALLALIHDCAPYLRVFACVQYFPSRAPGPVFPSSFFEALPALVGFHLPGGRDMTVDKLDLLIRTSPSLEVLDLSRTSWHPSTTSRAVLALLDRLPSLRSARLGKKPAQDEDEDGEKLMEEASKKRGIVLEWA